jgi:hypothetical protein
MIKLLNRGKIKQGEIHFEPTNPNPFFVESQPTPSIKHFPKWYKDIPRNYKPSNKFIARNPFRLTAMPQGTVKKCVPVMDAMSVGYIYSTPVEVIFDAQSGTFAWGHDFEFIQWHEKEQIDGWKATDELILIAYKWRNLNVIKTPPGWSTLFTHPLNRMDLPFQTLSAIVDTDKHDAPTHFPFFMKQGFDGKIPMGTPIVQMIPFKRQDWKSVTTNYDKDASAMFKQSLLVEDNYKKNIWEAKSYE